MAKLKRSSLFYSALYGVAMLPAGLQAEVQAALPQELLLERLQQALPNTAIQKIQPSAIAGLYEIVSGSNVFYADPSGRYLVFGHLYDLQQARDITQQRITTVKQQAVKALNFPESLSLTWGQGSRRLTVLFDPQCPWCGRLYNELQALENTRITLVLVPAISRSEQLMPILCSPNYLEVLNQFLAQKHFPEDISVDKDCAQKQQAAFAQLQKIIAKHQFQGTPYLISGDGRTRAGYLPAKQLSAWLDQ